MAGRIRRIDIAKLRADASITAIAAELRDARLAAGRSQAVVAHAARISQSQLARIERGQVPTVGLRTLVTVATMVGLKLSIKAYPAGAPIRDQAQVELLRRIRVRLGSAWTWRYEVPIGPNDLRAWDAQATHRASGAIIMIEAETRIRDIQALLRRFQLKRAAAGEVRMLMVVSDTHANREALAAARDVVDAQFPCTMRAALGALAAGKAPDADAVVVLDRERRPIPGAVTTKEP